MSKRISGIGGEHSVRNPLNLLFVFSFFSSVIFLIYSNTFDCSWHYDDHGSITNNAYLHLNELSWTNIRNAIRPDSTNPGLAYRPVAALSFAVNYYLGGLNVLGYHIVNVSIHLLCSLILFIFTKNCLTLPSLKGRYASKSFSIALLSSLLWAIHPVQIQAVTYIVQRIASLSALFYILCMYFYLKARRAQKRKMRLLFLIFSCLAFILALGSKENAAMLPVSLFLFEILIIQEDARSFVRKNIRIILLFWTILILIGVIYLNYRTGDMSNLVAGYDNRPFSITQRILTEYRVFIYYISLLLYPAPNRLSVVHTIQVSNSLFDPLSTLISIVVILGSVLFLLFKSKTYPLLAFCFLFFFVNHLIEGSVFPLDLIYEHRNYLPSMLFFVPIAVGLFRLLAIYNARRWMKYSITAFIILFLIGLGQITYLRNFTWKSEETLWSDAAHKAPDHFRPHHNLGAYYQEKRFFELAMHEYEKAIQSPYFERNDERAYTYYNLGKLYFDLNEFEEARISFLKALEIVPDFALAFANLAMVYEQKGKEELVDFYVRKALEFSPDDPSVNFNIGLYYLKRSKPEKAMPHFARSMQEMKLKPRALIFLGIASKQKGTLEKAVEYFRESANSDMKNITPHLHLAEVLLRMGNKMMSQQEATTALRKMALSDDLFYKTVDFISEKGESKEIDLPAHLLLPILYEASSNVTGRSKEWREYIRKTLERDKNIK